MEGYERKKMYRVHLKNISEIRNCRTPINYTAYPSRLFNFSLKTTFCKRNMRQDTQTSQPKLPNNKRKQQCKSSNFFICQENIRLSDRIMNASGSIDMRKYETEYEEHKKLLNLHRKVKFNRQIIMFKIYDITFRGLTPNLKEVFTVFERNKDKSEDELMKGNIFELRNTIIRGFRDERMVLKIIGRSEGTAIITHDHTMVPIMQRKEIVGTLILEVF